MDTRTFSGFPGIGVQIPSSYPNPDIFYQSVLEALVQIGDLRSGSLLLNQIAFARPSVRTAATSTSEESRSVSFNAGINVVIIPQPARYMQSGHMEIFGEIRPTADPRRRPADNANFWRRTTPNTEAIDKQASTNGLGTVAVVRWSNASMAVNDGTPSFVILAHELVHVSHYLIGAAMDGLDEENYASGIELDGVFGTTPLVSENSIRADAGLPPRRSYR